MPLDPDQIAERVRALSARVPPGVTLLAASKTRSAAEVTAAHAAGVGHFGENYAQELAAKAAALPGATWHFIGHLQRNKVKHVVGHASLVHTVGSVRLADELSRRAALRGPDGGLLGVLIEVNIGAEASKSGVDPEPSVVLALARHVAEACPGLSLRGLMAIPPPDDRPGRWFARVAALRDTLQQALGRALPELSMGMTHDFEVAIAHGATIIRVGTGIFGPRG